MTTLRERTAILPDGDSARPVRRGSSPVRVASVPAGHVYVQHLAGTADDHDVVRLDDPPAASLPAPGKWWPPAMLEPEWISRHADEFDLMHVHFGFDAIGPQQLLDVVTALREAGRPLIYTVHDLRNPHHDDSRAHDRALDVLIPHADALITLTPGAAAAVAARWGRQARVIAHPHVLDLDSITPRNHGAPAIEGAAFVVGIHAKSARASMRPLPVLKALLPLIDELPALRLRFDVHRDVFESDGVRNDRELAEFTSSAARVGLIDLRVHDYFTDEQLWAYLRSLDVSVLPYRFGTHSGWLEACFDLGTTVVAPSCGYFAQQRPCLTYGHDEAGLDADSLRAAVRRAYDGRPCWQADRAGRARERSQIAAAHQDVYASVLA